MAKDSVLVDGVTASLANTLETIFTAVEDTLIKAVTASNPTTVNASYQMNIVPVSGDTTKPEIPFQVVIRLDADNGADVVNHVIPKGGTLRISTSAADSIAFRVTGRILTP
jgi:hypothetical protein